MIVIEIKVVPSSGKIGFAFDKSGMIKCFLKSPPEKGKANKELIALIADTLDIAQAQVTIRSGFESRRKKIELLVSLSYDQILEKFGLYKQLSCLP